MLLYVSILGKLKDCLTAVGIALTTFGQVKFDSMYRSQVVFHLRWCGCTQSNVLVRCVKAGIQ